MSLMTSGSFAGLKRASVIFQRNNKGQAADLDDPDTTVNTNGEAAATWEVASMEKAATDPSSPHAEWGTLRGMNHEIAAWRPNQPHGKTKFPEHSQRGAADLKEAKPGDLTERSGISPKP